jgi:hypothetical protein
MYLLGRWWEIFRSQFHKLVSARVYRKLFLIVKKINKKRPRPCPSVFTSTCHLLEHPKDVHKREHNKIICVI